MLRVTVLGLPVQDEDAYMRLHRTIVAVAKMIKPLYVKDERDMNCFFPADLMRYGLGSDIAIDITHHGLEGQDNHLGKAMREFGQAVRNLYPRATVRCNAEGWLPEIVWSIPRG